MRQEAQSVQVLDYASARRRFGIHLPAAIVAAVVVLALNVWPHFVTTVGSNSADMPEPELGWPKVFFFYGQTYSGYGPWWAPERMVYDSVCAVLIVGVVGYAGWRITECRNGPAPR